MKNILSSRRGSYELLQKLGIKGMEILPPAPKDVDKVKSELSKYGLKVMSVRGIGDPTTEEGIERFNTLIEGAVNMEAKIIFVGYHSPGEGVPRKVTYERLRRLGDKAAAHDLTLCLETHPVLCHNGDAALETMEGVNHDNVRFNFDIANIYYYNENADAVDELKKVLKYVKAVHLKDSSGKKGDRIFPPLGDGIADFPEIFRILNAAGFYGPFTFELESIQNEDHPEALEKSVNYLRRAGCID